VVNEDPAGVAGGTARNGSARWIDAREYISSVFRRTHLERVIQPFVQ